MKPNLSKNRHPRCAAYTLVEVMIAIFVMAIMTISLYGGFSAGFAIVNLARENLRATQIMVQKTEDLRLYNWTQITNSTFLKPSFVDWYNPSGTNTKTAGAVYQGNVSVSAVAGIPAAYANNMRAITISLFWTNYIHGSTNKIVRSRQMRTYVARYGMQNFVSK